jgi:predicted nuclease with TOPRIM domain
MTNITVDQQLLESILEKKLSPLNTKIIDLNRTVEDVMKTIQFISSKYDEIAQKIPIYEEERSLIANENKYLKAELNKCTNEVKSLKEMNNDLEEYSRRECIEIRGIPLEDKYEQTNDIVVKIGENIGVTLSENDILVSHRLPISKYGKKAYPPAIIVKFVWTSAVKIFLRKDEDSPVIYIKNAYDLAKLNYRS